MITQKRDMLILFLKEQLLGPGYNGTNLVDIKNENLHNESFSELQPNAYYNEVIDNVPAGSYSTGILFPIDASQTAEIENDSSEKIDYSDEEEENEITGIIDTEEERRESQSINLIYPNSIGLTCCIKKSAFENVNSNIKINLSTRYYKRIRKKDIADRYGIILDGKTFDMATFIDSLDIKVLKMNMTIKEIGGNRVLLMGNVDDDQRKEIYKSITEFEKKISKELGNDREQTLSVYKQFLFWGLKGQKSEEERRNILSKIQEIESIESKLYYIKVLLKIHNSKGYGLWQSKVIRKQIPLPVDIPMDFLGKKIYSYSDNDQLRDIIHVGINNDRKASLSINLQLSKNQEKSDKIFLKIQVINSSTPFVKKSEESRYYSVFNEKVNECCFFGTEIKIESEYLLPYKDKDQNKEYFHDEESDLLEFNYRQYEDYGIGHGCSVSWSINSYMKSITTDYLPDYDIPDVETVPKNKFEIIKVGEKYHPKEFFDDNSALKFKWLSTFSDVSNADVLSGIDSFLDKYENWINVNGSRNDIRDKIISKSILDKCRDDLSRMRSNVEELLKGDDNLCNLKVFRLMNSAMFMQLWHREKVKSKDIEMLFENNGVLFNHDFYVNADDKLFNGIPAAWRPFQLAFIILNLDGIIHKVSDQGWSFRNDLVDLVWFPTGGGKTEAYLGIIAFTIIHRRIMYGNRGGGTAAIMRYTLRLLTLQQFQRATLLIMALELIRRWGEYELGQEPITIGLWVGNDSLHNRLDDLNRDFDNVLSLQRQNLRVKNTKIPFEKCPWCGHELNPIVFEKKRKGIYSKNRIELHCSRKGCTFSKPSIFNNDNNGFKGFIPTSLCDEEIYQHPPTLLFGTVDKFAQLAHKVSEDANSRNSDTRRLFGKGNWERGKPNDGYLTPDLIIQDELHLLLGPLGSAVALFESIIDQLCIRKENGLEIRPKIISSTATTRNTSLQIMALFNRRFNLFPKPGLDCDDSFFAFYKRSYLNDNHRLYEYSSKRKYFGVLPSGRTQMWMQMRIMALLLTHRAIFENKNLNNYDVPDSKLLDRGFLSAMDHYHSIISYFNSLREVGKTESQIQTYVIKEIRRVFNRLLLPTNLLQAFYTYDIDHEELTGRISGEEVKSKLALVSSSWSPEKRLGVQDEKLPPDIIIATNMISVGIDVSRFNTIIMNSMPRNIAEYIQASSRVARDVEGIVITVHHPFRARDVSHYERFIGFHEKMYSYVEPISITPFTKKAIDRYLKLYLATFIRHFTEFKNRNSANDFANKSVDDLNMIADRSLDYFIGRLKYLQDGLFADDIKSLLEPKNIEYMKNWIIEALQEWKKNISDDYLLVFNNKAARGNQQQKQLYIDIDDHFTNDEKNHWRIPQSLRVIEPEAVIKIKEI